jgi:hypothetical protein
LEPKALCIFFKNAQPSAVRRYNQRGKFFASLLCSRKMVAKAFRLSEIKRELQIKAVFLSSQIKTKQFEKYQKLRFIFFTNFSGLPRRASHSSQ